MDLGQTAVNALSYQPDRAPTLRLVERRQRGSESRFANVRAAPGADAGLNDGQGWSEAVGQALKRVSSTPNQPHRGFRPTEERPGRGGVASCNNFLRARATSRGALHVQIGGRNMTSVSSPNSTELGYGVSALQPAEPAGTTERPLALLYPVCAARQLRHVARPVRTASAVAGQ
jgi:hypothetical protein